MFELFRGVALVLAVITMGIVTGVLQLYSHTVMPGLGRTDDRTFVGAFQAIDRAIINPLFLATFLGEEQRVDDGAYVNIDGFNTGEKTEMYWAIRCYEIAIEEGIQFFVYGNLDYALK